MTAINVRVYVPDQWCSDQLEKQETNMCESYDLES